MTNNVTNTTPADVQPAASKAQLPKPIDTFATYGAGIAAGSKIKGGATLIQSGPLSNPLCGERRTTVFELYAGKLEGPELVAAISPGLFKKGWTNPQQAADQMYGRTRFFHVDGNNVT